MVITLRADFYDRPLHYPQFGDLVRTRLETLMPLSAEELENAIARPAERVGVIFEPGLVSAIIADVNYQPGALPLLQYALTELFELRQGRILTRDAYNSIGGTVGALAKTAEDLYSQMSETEQALLRQIFLRLVTLGEGTEDTRRRMSRAELLALTSDTEIMDEVIDTFAAYRLLSLDNDPSKRTPTVEVAHEAMLREWERLRLWINDNREEIRLHQQFANMVEEWRGANMESSFLAHGSRLLKFEKWAGDTQLTLTQRENEYLRASITERERKEIAERARQDREIKLEKRTQTFLHGIMVILTLATIIAFGLTGIAVTNANHAQRSADVSRSLALAADSELAMSLDDIDLALTLSMSAVNIENPPARAIRALSEAVYAQGPVWRTTPVDAEAYLLEVSPNGRYLAVGSSWWYWQGDTLPGADTNIHQLDITTGQVVRKFTGDGNPISVLDFSPDSQYLLSGSVSFTGDSPHTNLTLWDVTTTDHIRTFTDTTGIINAMDFTADGQKLLSIAYDASFRVTDNGISLWDIDHGQHIRYLEQDAHGAFVALPVMDARYLIVHHGDEDISGEPIPRTVKIVDVNADEILHVLPDNSTPGVRIELYINEASSTLILLSDISSAWNLETGARLSSQPAIEILINTSARTLSLSGRYLASGDATGTITVFDTDSWQEIARFQAHQSEVNDLRFTASETQLISVAGRDSVRLWDLQSGVLIRRFEHWIDDVSVIYKNVAFLPDGTSVIGLDEYNGVLTEWDINSGELLQYIEVPEGPYWYGSWGMDLIPNGSRALVGHWGSGTAYLFDLATGDIVEELLHAIPKGFNGSFVDLDISADGSIALTSSQGIREGMVLWDLASSAKLHTFMPAERWLGAVAISPDNHLGAVISTGDGQLILYDLQTYQEVRRFGSAISFGDIAFSPDGRHLLVTAGEVIERWDVETGSQIATFVGHSNAVRALAFHPDGKLAVSASLDGTIILWDLKDGTALRRYTTPAGVRLSSVAFSPDGQTVITGGSQNYIALFRVDPTLDDLLMWAENNRYVPMPSCLQRKYYDLMPFCDSPNG